MFGMETPAPTYTRMHTQRHTPSPSHMHTNLQLSIVMEWVLAVSYTRGTSTVSGSPVSPTLGRLYTTQR